jgi:hypothetical protein
VKDEATEITKHTTAQNRLLSALEAFYYCIVLLGGDVNSMNKQAVGLGPPFVPRPQTQAEKAAVAARKVQRVVKKRLRRKAVAARKVQRAVQNTLDGMVALVVHRYLFDLDGISRKGRAKKRPAQDRWQSGRWHKNYYGQWEKWTQRSSKRINHKKVVVISFGSFGITWECINTQTRSIKHVNFASKKREL